MTEDSLQVNPDISIPLVEIDISAVRARGAGGQNVNKVASAVHLRFDVVASNGLPEEVKQRLLNITDHRITAEGVIVIKAQSYRTQERNRRDALQRLIGLVRQATIVAQPRKKTRVSRTARKKRVDDKRKRGQLKQARQRIDPD